MKTSKFAVQTLVLAFFLILHIQSTFAKYEITFTEITIEPSPALINSWIQDAHQTNEIWPIVKYDDFIRSILSRGASKDEVSALERAAKSRIPKEYVGAYSWMIRGEEPKYDAFVVIDQALLNQLSLSTVNLVQERIIESGVHMFGWFGKTPDEIQWLLITNGATKETTSELRKHFLQLNDGRFYLPASRSVWGLLPLPLRQRTLLGDLDSYYQDNDFQPRGLDVKIHFKTAKDIEMIVEDFSNHQNPDLLQRYLSGLLARSTGAGVTIPIEKILSPFIRKTVNTFHAAGGPNCLNAACSANAGRNYKQAYMRSEEFLKELNDSYDPMFNNEENRAGDIAVFVDSKGFVDHASVFITRDIVFTKNGLGRFNPYKFEHFKVTSEIYEGLAVQIYRPRASRRTSPNVKVDRTGQACEIFLHK